MLRTGGPNVDEAMWHARRRYDDVSRCCFYCLVAESECDSSFLNHEYLGIWMTMNPSARTGWLISPKEGYRDVAKYFAFESIGICAVWQIFSFDKRTTEGPIPAASVSPFILPLGCMSM